MTNRIATTAAIILSLSAAGAPAASAMRAHFAPAPGQPAAGVYSRADKAVISTPRPAAASVYSRADKELIPSSGSGSVNATALQPVGQAHTPTTGFDWAYVGVGGGLALSLLGAMGAVAVTQRRNRRTAALPS